jgi:hypothetical protein
MPAAAVSFNPAQQTNFANTFFAQSDGFTQGDALDDPAIRQSLRKGIVATTATQPMWGGLAISEALAQGGFTVGAANPPAADLQSILTPAANITGNATAGTLTGFTVVNQGTSMIQHAQSRVPMAGAGAAINFYRTGSKARIPLLLKAADVATLLAAAANNPNLYWDTVNLWITASAGANIIGPIPNLLIDSIGATNSRTVDPTSTNFPNQAMWKENGSVIVVVLN